MTRRVFLLTPMATVALFAAAPGVAGRWIGSVQLPSGDTVDLEFNFKTSGEKLTGTVTILLDDPQPLPIADGKVIGSNISFTAERPRGKFSGTVSGDAIDMTVIRGEENTLRFTAKRAKSR